MPTTGAPSVPPTVTGVRKDSGEKSFGWVTMRSANVSSRRLTWPLMRTVLSALSSTATRGTSTPRRTAASIRAQRSASDRSPRRATPSAWARSSPRASVNRCEKVPSRTTRRVSPCKVAKISATLRPCPLSVSCASSRPVM